MLLSPNHYIFGNNNMEYGETGALTNSNKTV